PNPATLEEPPPLKRGVPRPEMGEPRHELQELLVRVLPIEPADLVVLAIGVVVPLLRATDFVAGQQHRDALREQQRREEVPLLACSQAVDRRIVRRSLDTTVPGAIVGLTVLIVLAVRFVVLVVVLDEVLQSEAVVTGDEVDARERPAPRRRVEIRRTGKA